MLFDDFYDRNIETDHVYNQIIYWKYLSYDGSICYRF